MHIFWVAGNLKNMFFIQFSKTYVKEGREKSNRDTESHFRVTDVYDCPRNKFILIN